jgi:hypothetical protein
MRLPKHQSDPIARAVHKALDQSRETAQIAGSAAGMDLEAVDWEVADAAYRWATALMEELAPGPQERSGGRYSSSCPGTGKAPRREPIAVVTGVRPPVGDVDKSGKNGEGHQ